LASVLGAAGLLWASLRPGAARQHRVMLAAALLPPLFYLVLSVFGSIIFMERFILITNVVLALYAFIVLPLSGMPTKWMVPATAVLAALLTVTRFDPGPVKKAVAESASERRKMAMLEESLPFLLTRADSAGVNIIVPYRRKMPAAYLLPSRFHKRLYSFREIVYQNAVHGIDVNHYSPAVALFLDDDFTGLENGFSFLAGPGPHHLVDYLYFRPLRKGPGYTVYEFGPGASWAPPRIFETR
jgi:hypothetical protein